MTNNLMKFCIQNFHNNIRDSKDFNHATELLKIDSEKLKRSLVYIGEIVLGQGHWYNYDSFKAVDENTFTDPKYSQQFSPKLIPDNLKNLTGEKLHAAVIKSQSTDLETIAALIKVIPKELKKQTESKFNMSFEEFCLLANDENVAKKFPDIYTLAFNQFLNHSVTVRKRKSIELSETDFAGHAQDSKIVVKDFYQAHLLFADYNKTDLLKKLHMDVLVYHRTLILIGNHINFMPKDLLANKQFSADKRVIDFTPKKISDYTLEAIHQSIIETTLYFQGKLKYPALIPLTSEMIEPGLAPNYMYSSNLLLTYSQLTSFLNNQQTSLEVLSTMPIETAQKTFNNYKLKINDFYKFKIDNEKDKPKNKPKEKPKKRQKLSAVPASASSSTANEGVFPVQELVECHWDEIFKPENIAQKTYSDGNICNFFQPHDNSDNSQTHTLDPTFYFEKK